MVALILELVWFFLPGIAANSAPVFAANWWPTWSQPIWLSQLGAHKTWRGVVSGLTAAAGVGLAQHALFMSSLPLVGAFFRYQSWTQAALMALVLGAGALAGDAVKSFIKRRLRKAPGAPWIVWDQIDFAVGMCLVSVFFVPFSLFEISVAIVVLGAGSLFISWCGVRLGVKKSL